MQKLKIPASVVGQNTENKDVISLKDEHKTIVENKGILYCKTLER